MAIQVTGPRTFTSALATAPWNSQTQASLRWKFLFSGDPTQTGDTRVVGRNGAIGVYGSLSGAGTAAGTVKARFTVRLADGSLLSAAADVAIGAAHDFCITHDGVAGTQTAWVDGVAVALGTKTGATQAGSYAWALGFYGTAPGTGCVYTIDDICAWDGYVLTSGDVLALRGGTDPTTIGVGATTRYRWSLATPSGKNPGDAVAATDITEAYGATGLNLTSVAGTGSAVWAAPLNWIPFVKAGWVRTGTSGKTIFIGLQTIVGNVDTLATAINNTPTLTVNGASRGALTGGLASGFTNYCAFEVPGAGLTASDVATLDAPAGWALSAAGGTGAMTAEPVSIYTGQSAGFRVPGYKPTLRMGINIDSGPTSNLAAGPYLRNLAYRLGGPGSWNNVSAFDATGKPTALSANSAFTGIINSPSTNGLDSTDYPGPVGLFAVGWDDLDPVNPTTFELYSASSAVTTVTERTDLANPGVNGIGKVRVYNIQRAGASARTYVQFRMTCASRAPKFDNLVIFGPGEFTYTDGQPTTLSNANPHAFSPTLLERLRNVASLRCYSPIIDGPKTAIAEWDQSRWISDWSYGDNTTKTTLSQAFTSAQPYDPATWPWIYSPSAGTKFSATLVTGIDANTTTLTVSDAATAPVLIGLRLFVGTEVMRVKAVSGTTVTVERGCHGTTPASHAAGAIQVGYRFASPTLGGSSIYGKSTWHILTSQVPHGLVTGQPIWPRGSGWPAAADCTNGVTMKQQETPTSVHDWTNVSNPVLVTGANTVLWSGGPSTATASVLLETMTLDPSLCYASRDLPDSAQVPYGVHAKLADATGAKQVWYSVPHASTDDFCWQAAREVRDNLRPGHEVWLELGNEIWHFQPAWNHFLQLSAALYPGQPSLAYYPKRSAEVAAIWRAAFDEGGRNRSGEIKLYLNFQAVFPALFTALMNWTASQGIKVDGVAVAPYLGWNYLFIDYPTTNYFVNLSVEQVLDHWIFNQWYQPSTNVNCFRRYMADWQTIIANYNATTGNNCQLVGYEGGLDSIFPHQNYPTTNPLIFTQTNWNERRRDLGYHPNLYIILQDWFALLEQMGFKQFNYFDLDNAVHLAGSGEYLWGLYKGYQQPHGRGDGSLASDGQSHDNRLCVAEPGQTYTKAATTSLDLTNVSVMGQAFLDWNAAATAPPTGLGISLLNVSRSIMGEFMAQSSIVVVGGQAVGGFATARVTYVSAATGGLRRGAALLPTLRQTWVARGGVALGGRSGVTARLLGRPRGGLRHGGQVIAAGRYSQPSRGGVRHGGRSEQLLVNPTMSSGGMGLGGHFDVVATYTTSASGGRALSGVSDVRKVAATLTSVAHVSYGGWARTVYYAAAATGGVKFSGNAAIVARKRRWRGWFVYCGPGIG